MGSPGGPCDQSRPLSGWISFSSQGTFGSDKGSGAECGVEMDSSSPWFADAHLPEGGRGEDHGRHRSAPPTSSAPSRASLGPSPGAATLCPGANHSARGGDGPWRDAQAPPRAAHGNPLGRWAARPPTNQPSVPPGAARRHHAGSVSPPTPAGLCRLAPPRRAQPQTWASSARPEPVPQKAGS